MVDVDQQLLDKTGNSLGIEYTYVTKFFENKYFGLKNTWGADGAPQTRTTC